MPQKSSPAIASPAKWIPSICAAAGILYGFCSRFGFVGQYNDDADYILAAQSILHGAYRRLSDPAQPPLRRFWPGFPLFLAPFVRIAAPHWALLSWLSIALVVGSVILTWRLTLPYLKPEAQVLLVLALCFHPLNLLLSSAVMTEPLFNALVLVFFLGLSRLLRRFTAPAAILQGLLLAWIMLIRPTGVILIPCSLLAFGLDKQWRRAGLVIFVGLAFWAPFPFWTYRATGSPTDYLGFWRQEIPLLRQFLLDHVHRVGYLLFSQTLLGISLPHRGLWVSASWVPTLAGAWLCVLGLRRTLTSHPRERALTWALACYLGLDLAVHMSWLYIDNRYFFTMLPVALFFLVQGGLSFDWERLRGGRGWAMGATVVWLLLLMHSAYAALAAASRDPNLKFPGQTIEWIRSHAREHAIVLGREPFLYLYTEHPGHTFIVADDREEFRYEALRSKFEYAVVLPVSVAKHLSSSSGENDMGLQIRKNRDWLTQWPRAFIPVYRNDEEQSLIFQVAPDPNWEAAYRTYTEGLAELQQKRFAQAAAKFRRSLAMSPDLESPWTALGIVDYFNGDFSAAQKKLTTALERRPDDILANLHLARIYGIKHRNDLALRSYQQAAQAISENGVYEDLLPAIRQESDDLVKTPSDDPPGKKAPLF